MKNEKYFKEFMTNEVDLDLNDHRIKDLSSKIGSIIELISNKLEGYKRYENQGSYALKTIIKPPKSKEFDADIMIYLKYNNGKEAKDYQEELLDVFKSNGTYKEIVKKKSRCVRIDYKGACHVDIVICIEQDGKKYICNGTDNKFEESDGTGYKDWLQEQNKKSGNHLKRVTRLMKYMRDIKTNFSCKSILLTTLLGNHIDNEYSSLPESLHKIMNNLNDFLHGCPNMPTIKNPALESEDFNRHWQDKYKNFREKINLYTEKINDAYNEKNEAESIEKWRKVFGEEFAKDYVKKSSSSSQNSFTTSAHKPYYFS